MPVIYQPSGRAQEYVMINNKPGYALNHYKGCSHGCKYCYGPGATYTTIDEFLKADQRKDIMVRILKEAPAYRNNTEPILLCFSCDPYQPIDKALELTREILQTFQIYNIYSRVLTKGGLNAVRDFDIMRRSRCEFGVSLSWTNDEDRAKWEPHAMPIQERIESLRIAKQCGIATWASIEPVIDPKQALAVIQAIGPYVDVFRVGKLNHMPEIEKTIDWWDFAPKVLNTLKDTGRDFYIKKDLRGFL